METTQIVTYLIPIILTLAYAAVGKLSSGETFDIKKFAETLSVSIAAIVLFALAGYLSATDLSALTATLPPLIAAYIMKAYAYWKKKQAGTL